MITKKKRYGIYLIGLLVLAFGIVMVKKANLGVSPITSIPSAASNLTPLTLGTTQTLFHVFCIGLQALLVRRITLSLLLQLPLSVAFGVLIDLYMAILPFSPEQFLPRCGVCMVGIVCTALGLVCVVSVDMILTAPDSLSRLISRLTGRPLGRIKLMLDVLWTVLSTAVEWLLLGTVLSVGLGTAASALLTGNLVTLFQRWFRPLAEAAGESRETG